MNGAIPFNERLCLLWLLLGNGPKGVTQFRPFSGGWITLRSAQWIKFRLSFAVSSARPAIAEFANDIPPWNRLTSKGYFRWHLGFPCFSFKPVV